MPRTPPQKQTTSEANEQRPDAWERFERAVDAAVKGGPKHRPSRATAKPDNGKKSRPRKDK
jgi:hypothetical protein